MGSKTGDSVGGGVPCTLLNPDLSSSLTNNRVSWDCSDFGKMRWHHSRRSGSLFRKTEGLVIRRAMSSVATDGEASASLEKLISKVRPPRRAGPGRVHRWRRCGRGEESEEKSASEQASPRIRTERITRRLASPVAVAAARRIAVGRRVGTRRAATHANRIVGADSRETRLGAKFMVYGYSYAYAYVYRLLSAHTLCFSHSLLAHTIYSPIIRRVLGTTTKNCETWKQLSTV